MAKPTRINAGILQKNDRRTSDKHPNMQGRANIDGVLYWISAWTKTGQDGSKFQGLAFKRAEERYQTAQYLEGASGGGGGGGHFDENIPY